jgi:hypothetical protein
MTDAWPWIAMALLGAYHGLNPAMGWLFAVGLGLQEGDRRAVLRALPPIAIGHELALAAVVLIVLGLGVVASSDVLHLVAAGTLIGFGVFRFARPRAHPRWTRARVNRRELTLWSFLMSSAHGAGLMVAPVLLGLSGETASGSGSGSGSGSNGLEAVGSGAFSVAEGAIAASLHVGAMLAMMAVVSLLVYDKLGVRILRKTWINLEWLWAASFIGAGLLTLFS